MHKSADGIFEITQEPLYIASSNIRQSNSLVVKAMDSQFTDPVFKTTGRQEFRNLVVEVKLPPRSGSSLEKVELHP